MYLCGIITQIIVISVPNTSFEFRLTNIKYLNKPIFTNSLKADEFEEKFIKGSGPGGQKINKSSSCVQLIHKKYPLVVKCQQTR